MAEQTGAECPTTTVEVPTTRKAVVITVEIEGGVVAGVQGINGAKPNEFTDRKFAEIFRPTVPKKHLGTLFYAKQSPDCVYWVGDMPVYFCED